MSKTALLFPGQGAQHLGMGSGLCAQFPAAADLFRKASGILGYDLLDVCVNGPADRLNSTVISQPALYTASVAALEKLKAESPDVIDQCEVAAGLSLGEYTALTIAGAMSFEDGLRLVQQRGQAMQDAADATPSGMVSILMMPPEDVEKLCQDATEAAGPVQIANRLCPGNIVVSGTKEGCAKALEMAESAGAKVVPLTVAGAFHTDIMRPADERLAAALQTTEIRPPRIPVISNVDAQPHSDPDEIRSILVRQVVSPVLWEDCMNRMVADGCDNFYEVGPGKVLKGLLKRVNRKLPCTSVNDSESV